MRDEAAAVLGAASLEISELPSFEELRARARGTADVPGFRLQKLAWAASVVLALGTGWLLRGGVLPAPDDEAVASAPAVTEARGGADEADATPVGAVSTREQEHSERSSLPSPAGVAATPAPEAAAPADAAADATEVPARTAAADPGIRTATDKVADVVAGDTSPAAELRTTAGQRGAPVLVQGLTPPSPDASEAVAPRASLLPSREGAGFVASRAASDLSAPDDALEAGGSSLSVPGLSVVSVGRLEEIELQGAVRVVQLMENGDTLELVHIPAGVDPALLPAAGDGRSQLLSPRAGGWLVLRARASTDALSELLRRLGGGD